MTFKRFANIFLIFILIFSNISAKPKKPVIPQEILDKVAATEETTSSWSVCEHKKKSIKKTVLGPLETEEAAYAVWIYLDLEPKKNHCIAKNQTYRTDSPNSYKQDLFSKVALYGQKFGKDKMLVHYILGDQPEPKTAMSATPKESAAPETPEVPKETAQPAAPKTPEVTKTPETSTLDVLSSPEEKIWDETDSTETSTSADSNEAIDEPASITDFTKIKDLIPSEIKTYNKTFTDELYKLSGIDVNSAADFDSIKLKRDSKLLADSKEQEKNSEKSEVNAEIKKNDSNFVLTTPEPKKNNGYTGYEKEYLQDYAPKKTVVLPQNIQDDEELILEPDAADKDGKTLLMKAVVDSDYSKVKLLIKSGANVNIADKDGWTALMYAARYQSNIFILKDLITAGADVKNISNYGISALYLSAGYGLSSDILNELLKSYTPQEKEVLKAFVLLLSDNSCTEELKIQKIACFINKNIRLNVFYNGKTPLQYACLYGNSTNIIDLLISQGCDINVRSTEGKTAFDYAWENKALARDDNFWKLNQN